MENSVQIPRLVIAGTGSGVGKTTTMVGLAQALQSQGLRVATFKCGPDYLDPTYHKRATQRPCHNLDGWMMGRDSVLTTFERGVVDCDIALIEGVMGLFDGVSPVSDVGSTAEIAKWLSAPVVLLIDASGMARTIAAIAMGFKMFDPELNLAGILCNRVGSRGHLDLLDKSMRDLPSILGGWPVQETLTLPERHLGLVTASYNEVSDTVLTAWGKLANEWLNLSEILRIAKSAPSLPAPTEEVRNYSPGKLCRIGIAFDEAFHFYYEDNLRRLESEGAELVRFSPIHDAELPKVDGLYLGGGYPEVYAEALSTNTRMLQQIRSFHGPLYAECGGLMYLCEEIKTLEGKSWTMASLLPGTAVMRDRLQALGYVEVETQEASIIGEAGLRFRGHQFRYSDLERVPDSFSRLYSMRRRRGGENQREGYAKNNILASYIHAHWASNPLVAKGFVASCIKQKEVEGQ